MANGNFGGGNGTEDNPYLVEDTADLQAVFYKNQQNPMQHYLQTNDINLEGIEWKPIGDVSIGPPFMGVYDGDNYIIKNLKVKSSSSYIGLFGLCDGNAILKNIHVKNADVESINGFYAAILAAYVGGKSTVSDCSVRGVCGGDFNGSNIAGITVTLSADSTIERCSADVLLLGHRVAGFSVYTNGVINDCYVTGKISGFLDVNLYKLQAAAFAYSCSDSCVIKNCYAVVSMNNTNRASSVMGLFALPGSPSANPTIISCYSDITAGVTEEIWQANVSYYASYDEYYVRGTDGELYKLINNQSDLDYNVYPPQLNYAAQPISGSNYAEYWEKVTPENNNNARTTNQLKEKDNFIGWKFNEVWRIVENETYPFLIGVKRTKCKSTELDLLFNN